MDTRADKGLDELRNECGSHREYLCAYARRLTHHTADAEDIVHDALARAIESLDQFHGGDVRAWLHTIVFRTFVNKFHRVRFERSLMDGPDGQALSPGWVSASGMRHRRDAEDVAMQGIVAREVREAFDRVPVEFRTAVEMCDVDGKGYVEIARELGCPEGTVQSRIHRGRKLLQRSLREHAIAMGIVP